MKILIDLKPGEPTTDQVFDIVYKTGADCDKRVIMYTGGKSENDEGDPTADQYAVESLTNVMN